MAAIAHDFWQEQADDPEIRVDAVLDPEAEDSYWNGAYWAQPYYRPGCEYEDYAPAFCVGYIGYAQYGGSFEDAEKSLWANWVRIKGDSRLTLNEAIQAIRAAWDHAEKGRIVQHVLDEEELADLAAMAARHSQRQPEYAVA